MEIFPKCFYMKFGIILIVKIQKKFVIRVRYAMILVSQRKYQFT